MLLKVSSYYTQSAAADVGHVDTMIYRLNRYISRGGSGFSRPVSQTPPNYPGDIIPHRLRDRPSFYQPGRPPYRLRRFAGRSGCSGLR